MAYQALYRRFRPHTFSDVQGQEHITHTLQNQIRSNRIGHAYIFTGTRGTGKTTVARILASAVNCQTPTEDGEPCGECAMCRSIAQQSSMNVIEIDAASNNGVENIREIISELEYPPSEGNYKVYIIDEVHMLSQGAFNALLKSLEEPPDYVVFILATTEIHKVPVTILSRCQRYDFKRITIDTIAGRLKELMDIEERTVEDKGLNYIARCADGSMRDALSLLDQCISFYPDGVLTYDNILSVLGAVDTEVFSSMLKGIMDGDVLSVMREVEDIVMSGRELSQFVIDFTWYLRNLMLLKSDDNMEELLDVSTENLAILKSQANMLDMEVLMRYIRLMSDLGGSLRASSQKRPLLEVALIRLMKPQMDEDYASVINRLVNLEEAVENGVVVSPAVSESSDRPKAVTGGDVKKEAFPEAVSDDVKRAAHMWEQIKNDAGGALKGYLNCAMVTVSADGNTLVLVFDKDDKKQKQMYEQVTQDEIRNEIVKIVAEHVQAQVPIEIRLNDAQLDKEHKYEDAVVRFANINDLELRIEED